MTHSIEDLHVYLRSIHQHERTSLSVLASLVPERATVLDLGCGIGALGQFLKETRGCTCDGVTLNETEATHASPHYRRVVMDNLETCDLPAIFAGRRYDVIVCADVLEHLSRPEQVLTACREMLAPEGKLLVSVPNAGYCGLVIDLLHGEFRYREEGLLDRTHLRFFTRRSLTRFFHERHWSIEALDTIQREWAESEFQITLDRMPAAVARYFLAQPDALTYQFIGVARPHEPDAASAVPFSVFASATTPAQAIFTAQLYLGADGAYSESGKTVARGVVGVAHQTLQFHLPAFQGTVPRLRLDPADRPGFLHLHAITLRDTSGYTRWQWQAGEHADALLGAQPHQQIAWHAPLATAPGTTLLLLTGDDPWFELPVAADTLWQCLQTPGAVLEVQLGWPMSADYLTLSSTSARLQAEINHIEAALSKAQQTRIEATTALAAAAEHIRHLTPARQQYEQLQVQHQQHVQLYGQLQEQYQQQHSAYEQLKSHLQSIENSTVFKATRPIVRAKMRLDRLFRPAHPTDAAARMPDPLEPEPDGTETSLGGIAERAAPVTHSPDTPLADSPLPAEPAPDLGDSKIAEPHEQVATNAEPDAFVVAAWRRPASGIDIVVPVYQGLDDTRLCLDSVLASTNKTPHRLIVINDASPDPELSAWLRDWAAQEPRITLLENSSNLGFVGTVNRGMALSDDRDVLLLNSDTEVANDWLDRLHRAAYHYHNVATVTPFSNNATIFSYPRFCSNNALPDGYNTAQLDALCAEVNSQAVLEVPTGVGFCLYIRRDSLTQVGLFDVENFGKGYGEENDFCLRATNAGWRHLHALDTFVHHTGGVSFGDSKNLREQAAQATLQRLHPEYESAVQNFVAQDPAQSYRHSLDLARLRATTLPRVLTVLHNAGGGTRRHTEELATHLSGRMINLSLTPLPDHFVRLQWEAPNEALCQMYHWPTESGKLLASLRDLGVCHVHYHHLLGVDPEIMLIPARLGITYDFTAHDYYTACPQIAMVDTQHSYCGEQGLAQCTACLAQRPAPTGETIEDWRLRHRLFLRNARYLLAPSRDATQRLRRYFPTANLRFAPHLDLSSETVLPQPQPRRLAADAHLRILVIGAVNEVKGADTLEAAALQAERTSSPLDFHLVGYAHRRLKTQPHASLTVHGAYADSDLARLLERLQPDVVWFPARWPETYSYTLSACLLAGVPIMAPDLGAFPERLSQRRWTWIKPWDTSAHAWVDIFEKLRDQHFVTGQEPPLAPEFFPIRTDFDSHPWNYIADYLPTLAGSNARPER